MCFTVTLWLSPKGEDPDYLEMAILIVPSLNSNVCKNPLPTISLYLDSLEDFKRKMSLHEKHDCAIEEELLFS